MESEVKLGPQSIGIAALVPSPWNPPARVEKSDALRELAANIREHGIQQPIIVRPKIQGHGALDQYEIVAGHRRHAAAAIAGLAEVPCIVRALNDQDAREVAIIENLHRQDLQPLEEAQGYQDLLKVANDGTLPGEPKARVESIAAKIGKSKEYVYASLKLLDLSKDSRELLAKGTITKSHGVLLARLDEKTQKEALREARDWEGTYSVRQLDDWVARHVREKKQQDAINTTLAKARDGGHELLQLSSEPYAPYRKVNNALPPGKWTEATEGCTETAAGLVVEGPYQKGQRITVCLDPNCKNHGGSYSAALGRRKSPSEVAQRKKELLEGKRNLARLHLVLYKVKRVERADLEALAVHLYRGYLTTDFTRIFERYFPKPPNSMVAGAWTRFVAGLSDADLARLIMLKIFHADLDPYYGSSSMLKPAAERYNVTDAEIEAEIAPPKQPPGQKASKPAAKPGAGKGKLPSPQTCSQCHHPSHKPGKCSGKNNAGKSCRCQSQLQTSAKRRGSEKKKAQR